MPVTDEKKEEFIRSDIYLPEGDVIEKRNLHAPLKKLLDEVRAPFSNLLLLSFVNIVSASGYVILLGVTRHNKSDIIRSEAAPHT